MKGIINSLQENVLQGISSSSQFLQASRLFAAILLILLYPVVVNSFSCDSHLFYG